MTDLRIPTKNIIIIFMILLCGLGLSGCWDHSEVENISIVLGVLVDTAPNDKVSLLVQVLNPAALAGGGGTQQSTGSNALAWRDYKASADTLFIAGRLLARQASPKLYFAQNQVIVISEKAAREDGLSKYIDYFERNSEFRRTNWVFIFRGEEPRMLFEDSSVLERTPIRRIAAAAEESTEISDFVAVRLGQLLNLISTEGIQPTIGGLQIVPNRAHLETDVKDVLGAATEKHNFMLDGNGVFRDSKLVGWLEGPENRGFLWVTDKMKGGIIEVPFDEEGRKVVLEIIRSKTKLEPIVNGDSITIDLKVKVQASIVESDRDIDYSDPAVVETLIRLAEERIAQDIAMAMRKAQDELRSDIFGFGCALNKKYPRVWREVKGNWDVDVFPTVNAELQADVIIRGSGLIEKGVQFR